MNLGVEDTNIESIALSPHPLPHSPWLKKNIHIDHNFLKSSFYKVEPLKFWSSSVTAVSFILTVCVRRRNSKMDYVQIVIRDIKVGHWETAQALVEGIRRIKVVSSFGILSLTVSSFWTPSRMLHSWSELLLCLCVLQARNKRVIQGSRGAEQGERSE